MDDIDDFIKILSDDKRIILGGKEIADWSLELVELCFDHRKIKTIALGGKIVPQFGEFAGEFLSFKSIIGDNFFEQSELDNKIDSYWESQSLNIKEPPLVVEYVNNENKNILIVTTLDHCFDRPIGLIWCLGYCEDEEILSKTLKYAELLMSICIKNQKTSKAIDLISQPLWLGLDTSEELFEYSAQICFESLSCCAVSIWLIESNILTSKYSKIANSDETLNLAMLVGEGIAGKCAKTNISQVYDDLFKEDVKHHEIVEKFNLRSGIFVPIHTFKNTMGVFAVYASRPFAFSEIDLNIVSSIVQWLNIKLTQDNLISEVISMKKKIDIEMPLIETGILAMSKIHDAKNQLNFAQAQLSYLTTWYYNKQNSDIYKIANSASNFIDETQEIITDLVQRSNLERKNLKKTSIKKLIIEIIESEHSICEETKIKVELSVANDFFPLIDKKLIKRAIQNLFDNSIHFLENVGRKRVIKISVNGNDECVKILFYDNGAGIYEKNLPIIFDVFYTTKGDKGMGFGLSIVRKIFESHGGFINVKSEWGEYTEFEITLPLKQ